MSNLLFYSLIGFAVLAWLAFLIFGVPWFAGSEFKRMGFKPRAIPESPEEVFLFTGQPNYAGLRNRTKELQADEAARAG